MSKTKMIFFGTAIFWLTASPLYGQSPAPAAAIPASAPDPQIAAGMKNVSPQHIQQTIEKLVSFGTRSTISAQDPASIASGRGIGAAREWIKSEFERYSEDCGGCLEVKTDSFTEAPAERIPQPTDVPRLDPQANADLFQRRHIVDMGHAGKDASDSTTRMLTSRFGRRG